MNRKSNLIAIAALATVMVVSSLGSASLPVWEGVDKAPSQARNASPEDRYAMAGGCYAIRAVDGDYVVRSAGGYAATAATIAAAEPFHFQATALGSYLLFDSDERFVSAAEGALADAVYSVTKSTPGRIAGGATIENTDKAAEEVASSRANEESGRGASVVAASAPSDLGDWTIDGSTDAFSVALAPTELGRPRLAVGDAGALVLSAVDVDDAFTFDLTTGCATYPEVEVNIDGPVVGSETDFEEVRGFLDAHLHAMAYEFLGGRARCGAPWHRFGVASALVDCPDHLVNGRTAALEQVTSGSTIAGEHSPDGWPSFVGWPKNGSLTHEQVYYKWLERAWRGGLRMYVNLLVDNRQLCQIYPFKRNSCNEMDGVRLQAKRLNEFVNYIDAQSGGPGEGWLRIVKDPFEARAAIAAGKLAVIMGIEVSVPLDCGEVEEVPLCTEDDINERLDAVHDMGVRQMELVNKFDNALSGVTGDGGTTGLVVNQGNKGETGHHWKFEQCEDDGEAHDKEQMNLGDQFGVPDSAAGRDSLAGGILSMFGGTGVTPVYPKGPHCNKIGLSDLGRKMITAMAQRGMIFDPDHMSARARSQAMDLIEELGYSGTMSSHSWADDTIYPRVMKAGGVVTPHAGGSTSFIAKWNKQKSWADPRYPFAIGFGSDINGLSTQGGPRGVAAPNKVTYPYTDYFGATVHKQQSGTKTYDVNTDGVAHYGLYPDWIQDLRNQAGDAIVDDLSRGPEAYLQMWERAVGIPGDACRTDIDDLTVAQIGDLDPGLTNEEVMRAVGQPNARVGLTYRFCVEGGDTATATFTPAGVLTGVTIA